MSHGRSRREQGFCLRPREIPLWQLARPLDSREVVVRCPKEPSESAGKENTRWHPEHWAHLKEVPIGVDADRRGVRALAQVGVLVGAQDASGHYERQLRVRTPKGGERVDKKHRGQLHLREQ